MLCPAGPRQGGAAASSCPWSSAAGFSSELLWRVGERSAPPLRGEGGRPASAGPPATSREGVPFRSALVARTIPLAIPAVVLAAEGPALWTAGPRTAAPARQPDRQHLGDQLDDQDRRHREQTHTARALPECSVSTARRRNVAPPTKRLHSSTSDGWLRGLLLHITWKGAHALGSSPTYNLARRLAPAKRAARPCHPR